jgi:hypothetical protein
MRAAGIGSGLGIEDGFVPALLSFHRAMAAFLSGVGNCHATPVAAQEHPAIVRNVIARTNSLVKRKLPVQLPRSIAPPRFRP